jgi:lysophospholipase L1-like esterase
VLASRGVVRFAPFRTTPAPTFWADIDPAFGVWHLPHSSFRHRSACYDVTYQSNAYGARDRERERRSAGAHRHVVLGDSMVEGFGVEQDQRFTDRLEAATGEEFLNFGTAGSFGTVQELMLYRSLASSFDHSDVLLFVLPANDFADNDPTFWPATRYRPYLRRSGARYEIYYPVRFEDREKGLISPRKRFLNQVSNHLYLLNVFRNWRNARIAETSDARTNSYGTFSDGDLQTMAESIRELAIDAASRPVLVFLVPTRWDLDHYLGRAAPFALDRSLAGSLRTSSNVRVIDLLPDLAAYVRGHDVRTPALYHACDEVHFSPLGHGVAAEAVASHLRSRQNPLRT